MHCLFFSCLSITLSSLIVCCVLSIFARIMDDFEWHPLVKQVGLVDTDVFPSSVNFNEPFRGGGGIFDAVDATPCVPPSMTGKRKRSDEVGGTGIPKKKRAPFSLQALK